MDHIGSLSRPKICRKKGKYLKMKLNSSTFYEIFIKFQIKPNRKNEAAPNLFIHIFSSRENIVHLQICLIIQNLSNTDLRVIPQFFGQFCQIYTSTLKCTYIHPYRPFNFDTLIKKDKQKSAFPHLQIPMH